MADASSPTPPEREPDSPKDKGEAAEQMTLWRLAGIGMELALTVGLFVALGWWLDEKMGWTPWGLLGCAAFGVVAGMYRFIRVAMK